VAGREKTEEPAHGPRSQNAAGFPFQVVIPARRHPEARISLNEYYSLLWARIKRMDHPENLLKEMVDFETIIVVIIERDGRIQKSWF